MKKFPLMFVVVSSAVVAVSLVSVAGCACEKCKCSKPSVPGAISLAGDWSVKLADGSQHAITLPGTLADAKLGTPATEATFGALTPKYQYVGKAVYERTITITAEQPQQELFLERVLWKSTVAIDGREIGSRDSFGTPHRYQLPTLAPGSYTLTVTVDNSRVYAITEKGHAYGDAMQTRWNGLLGQLTLRPISAAYDAQLYPNAKAHQLRVTFPANQQPLAVTVAGLTLKQESVDKGATTTVTYSFPETPSLWSPESPTLYTATFADGNTTRFAFRTFEQRGNKWFLNDLPFFMRGNIDNCHFPLTGYPPCDKAAWTKIFAIQKADGANAMRFHSWCPPAAAFEAADELGILMMPEAGIWIDGWMKKDFPDVVGLGKGNAQVDDFVDRELQAILAAYGNHASFFSLSVGNELGSSDFGLLGAWMAKCRKLDLRHLYAASTARTVTPADNFTVTHNYPGVGGVRERMSDNTNWDYEGNYSRTRVPCVAHEIGQWPVYPDWSEIDKYTGLLRPWNLEKLRDLSVERKTFRFNKQYALASLKTNRLMYKEEIESFMRTPSCAGIHLLGMQDYSGQGEALIGWLDSFYDRKPGAEDMVQPGIFFADVVYLARFNSFTWTANQTFEASFVIHNYSAKPIAAGTEVPWSFGKEKGTIKTTVAVNPGEVKTVGTIRQPLANFAAPSKQELTFGNNRWDLWVYPNQQVVQPVSVVVTDDYETMLRAAADGRKVLFEARNAGLPRNGIRLAFRPVYWSTTWFPGQGAVTLGTWFDQKHPAFRDFPTDDWQNWNWYHIVNGGRGFDLTSFPEDYQPIALPVVDFHKTRPAAALFEFTLGKGRVLACGLNLSANRPEARQLKQSLLNYLATEDFKPSVAITDAQAEQLFAPAPRPKAEPRPKEFERAPLYIECAAQLRESQVDVPFNAKNDRAEITAGTYTLTGNNLRTWRDGDGAYWVADAMTLTFKNLPNIRGQLLVRFRDANKNNRTCKGTFEGKAFSVPKHQDNPRGEYWLKLHVDMEDTLDNVMVLQLQKTGGSNIQIDRIVYLPNANAGE